MKQYTSLVLAIVLTAALLTGCGCTNQDAIPTTMPVTMPTTAPTTAPTGPSMETTSPTTATVPTTQETVDRGNGPVDDTGTGAATESTGTARRGNTSGR